ncbi:hypothetical protein [Sphingomonas sp. PB4P5]|uniref:hypothetical protein n=1 Tax=Parasphingomonas puruogangriensis TaxID=3096155 RepID=UPI002FCB82E3
MKNLTPVPRDQRPPLPDFKPVPRKYRYDGWTAERQRAFVEALADTGSVKAAAHRINMSYEGAYHLRRQPGAEGFRAAWEAALDYGIQCLADIAIERAVEGVAVPVFYKGEQCGEKRWYNDRLLMFILRHHLPQLYGNNPLPRGTRHPDTIAREAAENCPICRERAEQEAAAAIGPDEAARKAHEARVEALLERYVLKVRSERQYRLAGHIVAADYTLRQLTHIELMLDIGGAPIRELINAMTEELPGKAGNRTLIVSPMSALLDQLRRYAWAEAGEPDRPSIDLSKTEAEAGMRGGPTILKRMQAQRDAEEIMARGQRMWEAAATEDRWAAWLAEGGE